MTAIVARGIAVSRGGHHLLTGIDLAVDWGEVVAIVGPNGAGKSTLLGVLCGDLVPDQGAVSIGGRPLARQPARQRALLRAVLPQQTVLQFAFTARDVVAMGRNPLPASGDRNDDEAIATALAATDTLHLAQRTFPALSGGEQHRISLARVLAQETPILFLDEPTAALDIRHQQLVMGIARAVAARGGAVVVILHDLNLAISAAHRMAVLHAGRLVACDRPDRIVRGDLLSRVFDHPLTLVAHPRTGKPVILPDAPVSNETAETKSAADAGGEGSTPLVPAPRPHATISLQTGHPG